MTRVAINQSTEKVEPLSCSANPSLGLQAGGPASENRNAVFGVSTRKSKKKKKPQTEQAQKAPTVSHFPSRGRVIDGQAWGDLRAAQSGPSFQKGEWKWKLVQVPQ